MKYEAITPMQVFLSGADNEIYILTKVTGDLTLDEIRNAHAFVVPVEELPEPVPIDYESETDEPQATVWDPIPEPEVNPKAHTPSPDHPWKKNTYKPQKGPKSKIDHGRIVQLCQEGWRIADKENVRAMQT